MSVTGPETAHPADLDPPVAALGWRGIPFQPVGVDLRPPSRDGFVVVERWWFDGSRRRSVEPFERLSRQSSDAEASSLHPFILA